MVTHVHSVEISLPRRTEVNRTAEYLVHALGCEYWYAVCQREHQLVLHLTQGGHDRYAVSFDCTPSVTKAIYHGGWTTHFSVVPLAGAPEINERTADAIRTALSNFAA